MLSKKEGLLLYYIATMKPFGEEGKRRVERHRRLRSGKGFFTIEHYVNLNLTANEMFEPEGAGEHTPEEIMDGIRQIRSSSRHLIVVTNDIFSDGITYDKTTEQYQRYLGRVNRELAREADEVMEVVCGIPLQLKK